MTLFHRIFASRQQEIPFCSVVVPAAGSSRRMGGENKLLLPLGGVPVLLRTLMALEAAETVQEVILAARESDLVPLGELIKTCGLTKPKKIVVGGATRLHSVQNALREIDPRAKWVAVHDGDRPLITPELVNRVVVKARTTNAAAPAVPVKDTVKRAVEGVVQETPDRSSLFAVQTPQVFDAALLQAAVQNAVDTEAAVTDDCSCVELLGKKVYLVPGDEENLKITTPLDLLVAEAILERRERDGNDVSRGTGL